MYLIHSKLPPGDNIAVSSSVARLRCGCIIPRRQNGLYWLSALFVQPYIHLNCMLVVQLNEVSLDEDSLIIILLVLVSLWHYLMMISDD
jgi:hypothetical protein